MVSPDFSPEVRSRVFQAANELYGGDGRFPTVNHVRRVARVDMQAAATLMKEWRNHQMIKVPASGAIPEGVEQAFSAALAVAWADAQKLSEQHWDQERQIHADLMTELSKNCDAKEVEIVELKSSLDKVENSRAILAQELHSAKAELAKIQLELDHARGLREENAALESELRATKSQLNDQSKQISQLIQAVNPPKQSSRAAKKTSKEQNK